MYGPKPQALIRYSAIYVVCEFVGGRVTHTEYDVVGDANTHVSECENPCQVLIDSVMEVVYL